MFPRLMSAFLGWSDSSDDEGAYTNMPDGLEKIPDDEAEKLKKRFFEEDISDDDDEDISDYDDDNDDDEDMSEVDKYI
jgi:hypothetical protein